MSVPHHPGVTFADDVMAFLGVGGDAPRPACQTPTSVEGVLDGILEIGRAAGRQDAALHAVVALRERLDRAAGFVNPFADGPPGVVLTGLAPLTVGGFWIPQLVERAGAMHPLNATIAKPSSGAAAGPQVAERLAGPPIGVEGSAITRVAPEWMVICPDGLGLERAMHAAVALAGERWFSQTPAARHGRVAVLDGMCTLSRPGRMLGESFEFLVGWLNHRPGLIPPGFAWGELG